MLSKKRNEKNQSQREIINGNISDSFENSGKNEIIFFQNEIDVRIMKIGNKLKNSIFRIKPNQLINETPLNTKKRLQRTSKGRQKNQNILNGVKIALLSTENSTCKYL
ncbi:hypothetical protein A9Q91_02275 [Candidatus Gracilibacteria bacterium 28_42_T64]|nr:hypothetical protein A9Q91_02275 [Candidatus Gracilibacteria bacterium 28_42_T64]